MVPLNPNITKAVARLFSGDEATKATSLLIEQCGDNLPDYQHADEYDLERLRFLALKLSNGDIEKLPEAVRLATGDPRNWPAEVSGVDEFKRNLLGDDLEPNPKEASRLQQVGALFIMPCATCVTVVVLRLVNASGGVLLGVVSFLGIISLVLFLSLVWRESRHRGISILVALFPMLMLFGLPVALGFVIANVIQRFR